ncbi:MAG: Maf family protein [Candidatus Sumerlaeota bacterium]|nr:Maf family protein [Candidatus Sumerlaeota bacterium]
MPLLIAKSQRLILASASPRRRELLRLAGIECDVAPADIDEAAFETGDPPHDAMRAALAKALAVATRPEYAGRLIVGADTMVILDGKVFGKPADRADALRMLQALSGRTHSVFTGLAVVCADTVGHSLREWPVIAEGLTFQRQQPGRSGRSRSERPTAQTATVETLVTFRSLTPGEIAAYLDTPEPYDKAGAYGIQGAAGRFIERIEGDYYNVVGLPLERLIQMLGAFMDTSGFRAPKAPVAPFGQTQTNTD